MFAPSIVDVVEAAYSLDGTEEAWLTSLSRAAMPSFGRGLGIIGYVGETRTLRPVTIATVDIADHFLALLRQLTQKNLVGTSSHFYQSAPLRLTCLSRDPLFSDELQEIYEASGFVDGIGIYAHGARGHSIHLFAPSPVVENPDRRTTRIWERVASHLAAAHRLRVRLAASDRADAMLDASGRLHAANEEAASARDVLRDAVRLREAARTNAARKDGERALEMWQGLVAGRWSLVDRWESDGKRFIAAVENSPDNLDPRALRPREGAAAKLAAQGAASKDIAYALGISPSNARALLATALAKLGLASRSELLQWSPAQGHVLDDDGVSTLVLEEAPLDDDRLTHAEREVARLAASGTSNADIAKIRGTSIRTVANQMAAVLDKLRVHSRAEIVRSKAAVQSAALMTAMTVATAR